MKEAIPLHPNFPDATSLIEHIKSGKAQALDMQNEHHERLKALHPALNAAVQVFPPDEKTPAYGNVLRGIPISVKETFGLKGENITAGSKRMPPIRVAEDADIVKKIKKAGAFILCRGNVPEFAMTGETTNVLYGRSNNALDQTRTAGGSSGGEAALVASGSVAFSLGSDILGSIRIPAAFNGIVGFKPASEAVNKTGTWPDAHGFSGSFLSLGPLCRSVRDVRLVYNIIAEKPLAAEFKAPTKGRLIVPENFPNRIAQTSIELALQTATRALLDSGFREVKGDFGDVAKHFLNVQKIIINDFEKPMLDGLTDIKGRRFSKIAELLRQLTGRPEIDSGLFKLLLLAPIVRPRSAAVANKIIPTFEAGRKRYLDILQDDGILLLPTLGFVAPKHGAMNRLSLKPGVNKLMTTITFANYMNFPAITIPSYKFIDGESQMPGAIMAISAPGAEDNLLNTALVIEKALN